MSQKRKEVTKQNAEESCDKGTWIIKKKRTALMFWIFFSWSLPAFSFKWEQC